MKCFIKIIKSFIKISWILIMTAFVLWYIPNNYAEIKYSILDDVAYDDSNFLRHYVNKMDIKCQDKTYKFRGDHFDEMVREIKNNPSIAEYKTVQFDTGYLNRRQNKLFVRMLNSFKCSADNQYQSSYELYSPDKEQEKK